MNNDSPAPIYLPIHLTSLRVSTVRSFDIFIKVKNGTMVLYHGGGDTFTASVRDSLLDNGITTLYIRAHDRNIYNDYVEENLTSLLTDVTIPNDEKSVLAYTAMSSVARSLFKEPSEETVIRFKKSIMTAMGFILNREDALNHLIRMTRYDYSTAVHSVNVGILSMGLARAMFGDSGLHDMKEVAAGFFLHDIGITTVPHDILHKAGPLTHDEWNRIKQHPIQGYRLLQRFNALTPQARAIVMEHHERHNGKGYPKGLNSDSIHVYSKICIIADVFESLTSPRPYRQFNSSFQALKIMQTEMNLDLDPAIFKRFVMLFSGAAFPASQDHAK